MHYMLPSDVYDTPSSSVHCMEAGCTLYLLPLEEESLQSRQLRYPIITQLPPKAEAGPTKGHDSRIS